MDILNLLVRHSQQFPTWPFLALSGFIALIALVTNLRAIKKNISYSRYMDIEKLYMDLNKLRAIDKELKPELEVGRGEGYNNYCFMMWNFLETIYDNCGLCARSGFKRDEFLLVTWIPVVDVESKRYREWFDSPENRKQFKGEFRKWIDDGHPHALPAGWQLIGHTVKRSFVDNPIAVFGGLIALALAVLMGASFIASTRNVDTPAKIESACDLVFKTDPMAAANCKIRLAKEEFAVAEALKLDEARLGAGLIPAPAGGGR